MKHKVPIEMKNVLKLSGVQSTRTRNLLAYPAQHNPDLTTSGGYEYLKNSPLDPQIDEMCSAALGIIPQLPTARQHPDDFGHQLVPAEPFRQRFFPVLTGPVPPITGDPDEVDVIVQAVLGRSVLVR
jgi:hypothetical protein